MLRDTIDAMPAPRRTLAAAWLVASALTLAWACPAGADPATRKRRAAALFVEGTRLAAEKRWADAIDRFRRSDREVPYASNDCNIATVYSLMGRPAQAQLYLGRCIERHGGVIPLGERPQVEATWREVDQMLTAGEFAPVAIVVDPLSAQVRVSSFAAEDTFTAGRTIWLPFGSHEILVSSTGRIAERRTITIRDRRARREVFALAEARPIAGPTAPTRRGPLPYVLLGGGAAALAAGALFTALALDARDDARDAPDLPAHDDAVDRMKRYNLAFDAAYAVGAVSIGAGLYLFLRPGGRAGPAERLSVGAGPGALTVRWQTAW